MLSSQMCVIYSCDVYTCNYYIRVHMHILHMQPVLTHVPRRVTQSVTLDVINPMLETLHTIPCHKASLCSPVIRAAEAAAMQHEGQLASLNSSLSPTRAGPGIELRHSYYM
jgi:hypothetical protein